MYHIDTQRGQSGACPGDSGSPLFKLDTVTDPSDPRWVQLGVLHGSVGPCASSRFPNIFSRVSDESVLSFIKNTPQERFNKVMLVGGGGEARRDVEVIDLSGRSQKCVKPNDFIEGSDSTGAYFDGYPTVCGGGQPITAQCYKYNFLVRILLAKCISE